MKVDLHIHTVYSDGTYTPQAIVDTAVAAGLDAIAITDHDNVLAYDIAQNYIKENNLNIEVLPGVEINTIKDNQEIHILGYFMNFEDKDFKKMLKSQQNARIAQTEKIVQLLNKKANIHVTFEQINAYVAEGGSIGRPHIAKAIVAAGGALGVVQAYAKYINDESNVYVQRETISPHDAVEIIYEAGGIPVLAHPCDIPDVEKLVKELMNYGLRGIEAYHRKHSAAMNEYYTTMAEKYNLIVTGGSDFHSPNPNNVVHLGKIFIPEWVYDNLKKEAEHLKLSDL